jgi:hypothetical protein
MDQDIPFLRFTPIVNGQRITVIVIARPTPENHNEVDECQGIMYTPYLV